MKTKLQKQKNTKKKATALKLKKKVKRSKPTMSTNDVPGYKDENGDKLAMGCWAEHDDGSLIFVESTEGNRVVYSIFDVDKDPPIEYRDAMAESTFKKTFSWDATKRSGEKWTWHDKTPFDWNRIIKRGIKDGPRLPSADHILNAAERVAQSLKLRGHKMTDDQKHRVEEEVLGTNGLADRLHRAIDAFLRP